METKTYFASSIQAAIEVARKELGEDAMLVESKPASDAGRAFGRLEVTFAWEPGDMGKAARLPVEMRRAETGLEDIRQEISALRAAIGRPGAVVKIHSGVDDAAVESLRATGFEKDTARELVLAAAKSTGRANDGMSKELTARIPVAAFPPFSPDETRTLAFVGPSGRGKTTSLIKIAVRYGLAAQVPVRVYMAGAHAVGATEQMARFAAILAVPFQAFESFESLHLALQGDRWKGLVLIDTPGLGLNDQQEMEAMARFFGRRPDIERHLVLRAEARSADIQYMLSRFSPVRPSRLLFTGLDEVTGLGAAANAMIRSGIAATFFGTGSQIPEDLEEVDVAKLSRSLLATKGLAARAA